MPKWEGYGRFCSLARGLDLVGERWTLVIIQELMHAARRYSDLRSLLPGIGSNVLSDRLRRLETGNLVQRIPGPVGEGVQYALTDRGRALGPALAMFREWGLDELLPSAGAAGGPAAYDLSYAVPAHAGLHETYEWRIDQDTYHLDIDGTCLTVTPGPAGAPPAGAPPAVTVRTTRDFMRRWVAGEVSWDQGRADGRVHVRGTDSAWNRMLLATGYPGRPRDLARRLFPPQAGTKAKPAEPGRPPAQQDTHRGAGR
jgi:DNA-binding HxlR family transcriptional regulator